VAERLLVLLLAAAAICVAVLATRAWTRATSRKRIARPGSMWLDTLNAAADGRPIVVTFSTPSCAACHTAQAPAVEQLERQVGSHRVRLVSVDAAHQPEVARAFGVLTVPSSVVLDASGRVTAVNHGFAPTHKLLRQLQFA
jgi:thiol-disulfide isomerase/thioredoxin